LLRLGKARVEVNPSEIVLSTRPSSTGGRRYNQKYNE
jgi:hypothetical protein